MEISKDPFGSPWLVIVNWKRISMLFCKERLKNIYPMLNKLKKESWSDVNVKLDGNDSDSSYFSLFITLSGCHSDVSEWVLDTASTRHIYPRRGLFASFEELDGGLMSMVDDHTCQLVKVQFVSKMYD